MALWQTAVCAAASFLIASCVHPGPKTGRPQPIIDMHRHTPWPGDPDAAGLALIRKETQARNVVAAALFITGREDIAIYRSNAVGRFLLSPMFPCPALTAGRKWCFSESDSLMPDAAWLDQQLAARALGGIGELVFSYAAVHPNGPAMLPYWELAAKHDVPAFVHIGRGPDAGQGPRRHVGCCANYTADYGNPALLQPVLEKHPTLRLVLQHAGFDYMEETIAVMRRFPNVYAEMSVLNSIGPRALHDASLRRFVEAGLADRVLLGSDDQDYATIIERIEEASFLTPAQRRGIYYDNAARFLRLDVATIASDHRAPPSGRKVEPAD